MNQSRFLTRALSLVALVFIVAVASPSQVGAHALLVHSDPAQDARLLDAPSKVAGWFSEPLEPGISSLKIVDASGQRVDSGETRFDPSDPSMMSVSLADNVGPGFYLVTWETLSRIDGHFRFGSFQFAVLNPDGSLPPNPSFEDVGGQGREGVDLDRSIVKSLSILGQVGLFGAVAFQLFVALPAASRQRDQAKALTRAASHSFFFFTALTSVGLLVLAAVAELLVQMTSLPGSPGVSEVLATSWGERWLQKQFALLVIVGLLALHLRPNQHRQNDALTLWFVLGSTIVYLLLTSLTSHAAAIERGTLWATAFDFVHLLMAALWVGALVQLAGLIFWSAKVLSEPARSLVRAEALRRFSLLAATAALPLLATGVLNALIQVPSIGDLIETTYGLTLIIKLAFVFILLSVAAVNALVLRPNFLAQADEDRPTNDVAGLLSRLVPVEAALGIVVLLVTGVLTQLTTARALAQIAGETAFTSGSDLADPLASGGWTTLVAPVLITLGGVGLLWTKQAPGFSGWTLRNLSRVSIALPILVLAVVALDSLGTEEPGRQPDTSGQAHQQFEPRLSLLLQDGKDRFVSLQVEPFEVGDNVFRTTVLDRNAAPITAEPLSLRFSRLESNEVVGEVEASLDAQSGSYFANFVMTDTGWWAIQAQIGETEGPVFYIRLDKPSRAPDSFAPPVYKSDPAAEAFFEAALNQYQKLSSVRWSEQLTSGHPKPTGYGVWYVTVGEAVAPDKLHFSVFSMQGLRSSNYYVGATSCSQTDVEPLECSPTNFRPDVFDLDFFQPTAFKLGPEEVVDGEISRVVFFYNPNQAAWYVWWVGADSGHLRRQAMVATGHFMLTSYFGQNEPVDIELPVGSQP